MIGYPIHSTCHISLPTSLCHVSIHLLLSISTVLEFTEARDGQLVDVTIPPTSEGIFSEKTH